MLENWLNAIATPLTYDTWYLANLFSKPFPCCSIFYKGYLSSI